LQQSGPVLPEVLLATMIGHRISASTGI